MLLVRACAVAVGCALALALAGCGGDDTKTGTLTTPRVATAVALPPGPVIHDAPIAQGRAVLERVGCLACHQLFTKGNPGPGDSLAGIGARKTPAEIRRALVSPRAPMPSFRRLPAKDLSDLVAYLSALRGNPPGGPPCPEDIDCG